jgi:hypothetical protein
MSPVTERFWFADCPVCEQGRLFAKVRSDNQQMIVECEECYVAWSAPDQVSHIENGFLAIEVRSSFATAKDIADAGWDKWDFRAVR